VIVPWLQLNSLGLDHPAAPNTEDPRADHLYYALWVNRSQPVHAYGIGSLARANRPSSRSIEHEALGEARGLKRRSVSCGRPGA